MYTHTHMHIHAQRAGKLEHMCAWNIPACLCVRVSFSRLLKPVEEPLERALLKALERPVCRALPSLLFFSEGARGSLCRLFNYILAEMKRHELEVAGLKIKWNRGSE